ncbi:signal peptidase I [Photobacterium nomapromontoriensis]|uniref:signal peptidase I n=1 Tax=Photobacterium nomapromontoriensis TaxID=2910237 RepID=UPI003D0F4478
METYWKPKGWLAIILGIITQQFVFLYVNKARYFGVYSVLMIAIMIIDVNYYWVLFILCPVHAYIAARRYKSSENRLWYARWWMPLLANFSILSIIFVSRVFIIDYYSIPSSAMAPSLNEGEYIVIDKRGFGNYRFAGVQFGKSESKVEPERGEIIAFQYPKNPQIDFVQRIIGLPGDTIVYKNKKLVVIPSCEGKTDLCSDPIIEKVEIKPYDKYSVVYEESIDKNKYNILNNKNRRDQMHRYYQQNENPTGVWKVPAGQYFVMGDNRDNSLDSRYFGFVPKGYIIGTVAYSW